MHVCHEPFTFVSLLISICAMTDSCVCHGSCVMAHSHVCHDPFTCVSWLINMWHDSFMCVLWLIHMCAMTRSYMWHDSFILWHDSFIRHSCGVSHDSLMCVTYICMYICTYTYIYIYIHIYMCIYIYTWRAVARSSSSFKDSNPLLFVRCMYMCK